MPNGVVINVRLTGRPDGLASPTTKSGLLRSCGSCASEPHTNPVDASPDYLCCAPNSGERVLKIEAARQPALPAKRQLRSTPR